MVFTQFIRFTSDASAIEKILRLLQSLSQILAVSTLASVDAKLFWELRRNFALGRRYLRFFRFLDCFSKAYDAVRGLDGIGAGAKEVLGVGRWTFMGCYLLLESATILDTMRVYQTPWAETCLLEGNKFWFYSLICGILAGGLQLLETEQPRVVKGEKGKSSKSKDKDKDKDKDVAVRKKKRAGIKRRMIVDAFDLFIPGDMTGWIPTSLEIVGWASAVSTVLSMKDIWDKAGT